MGSHLPRQCGIATFTSDLADSLESAGLGAQCTVVAMNDVARQYQYSARVRFEIAETESASYRRAADFLNVNGLDVVCLQHEYGIFGGKSGTHILAFMRNLRAPLVTTLHTILTQPSEPQQQVMKEVIDRSTRLVVMTESGAQLLKSVYRAPTDKIDVIPHGIDDVMLGPPDKQRFGVAGQSVILTFGLLSPDKGLEFVIDALPRILEQYPNTVYVIVGATHPHVKLRHGETYRLMLQNRAMRLGVESHVIFHDRFVSQHELREFLAIADVYLTPYLNTEQASSGTLAYAVGSGKAVISTPYRYATELLDDGRGLLVPCRDSSAIAKGVIDLFGDDATSLDMRNRCAALGQLMRWSVVARQYFETFEQAIATHSQLPATRSTPDAAVSQSMALPEIKLSHLRALTDSTGLLQHADFDVPCYEEGYCLDDNARALLLTTLLEDYGVERDPELRLLSAGYLAFVSYAFDWSTRRFRNQMTYARTWREELGSEDSHCRALWALGAVIGHSGDPGRQSLAGELFQAALPIVADFTSPRAWALAVLGISEYLRPFRGDTAVHSLQKTLAERLVSAYERVAQAQWKWFEETATYSNARLSQALVVVGRDMQDSKMLGIGLESLSWLVTAQTSEKGHFSPIGCNGFWRMGKDKAPFDQQPIESCAMVSACLEAWRTTGNSHWLTDARRAFYWFLGDNHLEQALYDDATGGCRDGLHEKRVNQNQGAESTLSFLLALLEMRAAERPLFSQAQAGLA